MQYIRGKHLFERIRLDEQTASRDGEISLACVQVSYDRFVYCLLVYVVPVVSASAASSTITPWTVNTHMHLLRIDHHLTARQSLCAEMASELRFAVRCGSRQRPAAKSRNSAAAGLCGRCSPRSSRRRTRLCSSEHEETTYIPSIEIPRLNGVSLVPHDGHAIKFFAIGISSRIL